MKEDLLESAPSVFLVEPEHTPGPEASISHDGARRIFEAELASWHDNDDDWPPERNRENLGEWFDVYVQEMVLDLEHKTLDLEHL